MSLISKPDFTGGRKQTDDDVIQFLEAQISECEDVKMKWNPLWMEVQRFVYPDSNNLLSPIMQGANLSKQIFDETAINARQKLESGIYSYTCAPNQQDWFSFESSLYEVNHNDDAKRWYSALNNILMLELIASNFVLEIQLAISQLITYGTCCLYVDWDAKANSFFFKCYPINTFMFKTDRYGRPSTVFVKFDLSATEAVNQFGKENLSQAVQDKYKKECKDGSVNKIEIWHVVGKRENPTPLTNMRPNKSKSFPYYSIYYERETKHAVSVGGYREMPYIVSRFKKKAEEDYGRSPAMACMPSIKEANYIRYKIKYAADKHVDPPIMIPQGGVVDLRKFSQAAGAKNKYNPTYGNDKPYYLQPAGNIPLGEHQLENVKLDIREAFYEAMFDALGNRRNMTAIEVTERTEQQLTLFSPTQGRLQCELFDVMLERCGALLLRTQEKLPPVPMVIRQYPDFKIAYRNKLALSIRNIQNAGFQKTMNMLLPLFERQPQLLDNFDLDIITRDIAMSESMKTTWLKPLEQMMQQRQAQMEQAKKAQEMEQMEGMAKAVPALSKSVEPNSVLSQLKESMPQGE